jgi:uncharacterized protein YaaN involved in tellurite resistance
MHPPPARPSENSPEVTALLREIQSVLTANSIYLTPDFDKHKRFNAIREQDMSQVNRENQQLRELNTTIDKFFERYVQLKGDTLSAKLNFPHQYGEKMDRISTMISQQKSSLKKCREDLKTAPDALKNTFEEIKTEKSVIEQ